MLYRLWSSLLSRAISFFLFLGFWLLGKKKRRKLHWGKMFRLLQYNNVAMALFLQLCCYFCVLQNPCLGYKLQQKEQTLPPVSIYVLFELLLARPSGKFLIPQLRRNMLLSEPTTWDWEWLGRILVLQVQLLFVTYYDYNSQSHVLCVLRAKHLPSERSKHSFIGAKVEEAAPGFPTWNFLPCPPQAMYGFEHCLLPSASTAPVPRVAGTSSGSAIPNCSTFPFIPMPAGAC